MGGLHDGRRKHQPFEVLEEDGVMTMYNRSMYAKTISIGGANFTIAAGQKQATIYHEGDSVDYTIPFVGYQNMLYVDNRNEYDINLTLNGEKFLIDAVSSDFDPYHTFKEIIIGAKGPFYLHAYGYGK